MRNLLSIVFSLIVLNTSAQYSKKLSRLTEKLILKDSILSSAQIGISIYDPEDDRFLYNYNDERNFIPGSTVKLFTLYASLKNLQDSLIGIYYKTKNDTLFIFPSGDPTFMHHDFKYQPVHDFLNSIAYPVVVLDEGVYPKPYGKGWTIDDMDEVYMPQRSLFPVNGNLFSLEWTKKQNNGDGFPYELAMISIDFPDYEIIKKTDSNAVVNSIHRLPGENRFEVTLNNKDKRIAMEVPFETSGMEAGFHILKNTLYHLAHLRKSDKQDKSEFQILHSQSTDSVMTIMMHRSDNFYAEQTLMMIGDQMLGYMDDEKTIDTLLKSDFIDIPQKPRWVDGSGLSRYNLFSPKDEIYILKKLTDSFGIDRMKKILPSGGEGTLKQIFLDDAGFIFAKTGSMTNQYCISGILITKRGKPLIFSLMTNNYIGKSAAVKKSIEQYIHSVREMKL